ncbi:TonB-dependent Receptor Plug Domain [Rhodoferax sp. OV413]|uniref:STN domain-containing protein n=1 Tax=Rhodoferax sp. OV413 TaxID=1855285 RepID=UPI0008823E80|nr:TonB-dependent siderophore receptor [Rhodoferax sp. OV413]SDO10336.1 TonB-dependent Receptor Plug Domain [Rhodoferax sp. OV413]
MTYQRIRFPRNALAAAVLAGACLQAYAQTASFEIAAQPLADALAQFGRQSGAQLVFAPGLVQGLRGNAVHGSRDVAAALAELLRGTGLQLRRAGATLTLERVPADAAVTLPPVTVTAAAERETATGPVIGYVAKRSATATKTDTPLVEIPQSISVIGAQELEDKGVITLTDGLAQTPGVTVNPYGHRQPLRLRFARARLGDLARLRRLVHQQLP